MDRLTLLRRTVSDRMKRMWLISVLQRVLAARQREVGDEAPVLHGARGVPHL
jgi:hypothetical protein